MTATERLRAMLDERGVEWGTNDTYRLLVTSWKDASGHSWAFMEHRDGSFSKLTAYHLTPAQAIAATLGRETCHITRKFTCSECGHQYPTRNYESYETCDGRTAFAPLGYNVLDCKKPNYCPNCGREVD